MYLLFRSKGKLPSDLFFAKNKETVQEEIKPFICNIRDKSIRNRHNIESVHEDIKPFKCNICEHETAHIADLKKHVDSVHEGIQPYLGL